MSVPTVTVQTAVYNAERWIQGALDSILNQTYDDFEYIVVNDGSTDNTERILKRYAEVDERIRVVNQPNLGAPRAHNRAIELSRGRFIAILDADDLALSRRLEYQVQFLESRPEYGMVGGSEIAVHVDSGKVWLVRHPSTDADLRRSWVWRQKFAHSAVMMRKEILCQTGLYNERLKIGHDPDLWARIAAKFPVANLQDPVVVRRHHSGSLSKSMATRRLLVQLELNAKAVRRLSLPFFHYLAVIVPVMRFCLPEIVARGLRRCLCQEEMLMVEELVRIYRLSEQDIKVLRIALSEFESHRGLSTAQGSF